MSSVHRPFLPHSISCAWESAILHEQCLSPISATFRKLCLGICHITWAVSISATPGNLPYYMSSVYLPFPPHSVSCVWESAILHEQCLSPISATFHKLCLGICHITWAVSIAHFCHILQALFGTLPYYMSSVYLPFLPHSISCVWQSARLHEQCLPCLGVCHITWVVSISHFCHIPRHMQRKWMSDAVCHEQH